MEDFPPDEFGRPFLEWYKELYESFFFYYDGFFKRFYFLSNFQENFFSEVKKGLNLCNQEIYFFDNSLKSVPEDFLRNIRGSLENLERMNSLMENKIEKRAKIKKEIVLNFFSYWDEYGVSPH
ncbi:hypothetical protein J4411_01665 [Candidatus Pacearchaeota archaeon]|nr:hypothetical protein [Candidatus Pacearchaeota archaeon]